MKMRTIQIAMLFALCVACESAEERKAEMERAVFLDARLAEQDAWMAQDVERARFRFEADLVDPSRKEAAKNVEHSFRRLDSLCNDVGSVIVAVCEELIHQVDGLDTVYGVKDPAEDWSFPELPMIEEVLGSVSLEQVMKSNPDLKRKWDSLGMFQDSLLHLLCDRRMDGKEWSYTPRAGLPVTRWLEEVHPRDQDIAMHILELIEPYPPLNGNGSWSVLESESSLVGQVSLLRSMAIAVRKAQNIGLDQVKASMATNPHCFWIRQLRALVHPQEVVVARGELVYREVGLSWSATPEHDEIRYVIDNPSLDSSQWKRSEKGKIILDTKEPGVHVVHGYLVVRTARGVKNESFEFAYVVE